MTSRAEQPASTADLPQPPACPVCRTSRPDTYPRGSDRLFGLAKGTFALFRCTHCGCIFQHPLPEPATLAGFYPRQYWWSEKAARASQIARILGRLEKAYREFVTADHVRFLGACARKANGGGRELLDIGCGNGTFLHVARSRGFDPRGMDVSARAVEIARDQYGLDVRQGDIGSRIWEGSRFDYVTMFHVLEHLTEPGRALTYAKGLLKPSGMLILQVPNVSSLQARVFRTHWYGLDVPRHVINFTPKALSLLLKEAGFEYRLVSRFSLRDNPASIASSLVPWLDPIRRKGRGVDSNPVLGGVAEFLYLGLFLLLIPAAFLESACGCGGTIWVCATPG